MDRNRRQFLRVATAAGAAALLPERALACLRRRMYPVQACPVPVLPVSGWGREPTIAAWKKGVNMGAFTTTAKMPPGAELRIRVVACPPKGAVNNGVMAWKLGGVNYYDLRQWDNIDPGQQLRATLPEEAYYSISTPRWIFAAPDSIEFVGRDFHRLTMSLPNGRKWILDVKIVAPF